MNCDEVWSVGKRVQKTCNTSKTKRWDLYSRVPNFRLKNKENFEEDFKHRAVYDGKVNERKLQEWIDEMQPKVHAAERQLEIRDRKRERAWMESEDSSSHRRRAWEKRQYACSRKSSFTDGVSPSNDLTSVLSCSWDGEHLCILSGLGDCPVDGCSWVYSVISAVHVLLVEFCDNQCISNSSSSLCQNTAFTRCRSENGYRPEQIYLLLAES